MSQIILCITDQPEKFSQLRKIACAKNLIVITSCRIYHVLEYLRGPYNIVGIALDFEMPFGTGVMFVRHLKEENVSIPIVITEKDKYGIQRVKDSLKQVEYEYYTAFSSSQSDWELKAIRFWFPDLIPESLKLSALIFNLDPIE